MENQEIKNNTKSIWFKRKLYGWGWTPVTWQGWLMTLLYAGIIVLFATTLQEDSSFKEILFTYILPVTLLTFAFFYFLYKKGEKPRWQWGEDKIDS